MAAQASRVTKAAEGAKIGRTPLTRVQREERSRRATIKTREKGRQATALIRGAATQATLREAGRIRRENIAAQTRAYEQRNLRRNAAAIARRRDYNALQTREEFKREVVTRPLAQGAAPVARSGFVLLGLFAALIVLFAVLNNPQGFTGWLGGLGNFMATFTQNGPLFSKNTGS